MMNDERFKTQFEKIRERIDSKPASKVYPPDLQVLSLKEIHGELQQINQTLTRLTLMQSVDCAEDELKISPQKEKQGFFRRIFN